MSIFDLFKSSQKIPVLPLKSVVVFPNTTKTIHVGRLKSINAVQQANSKDQLIFALSQRSQILDDPSSKDLYMVGTLCKIIERKEVPKGFEIKVEGLKRVQITDFFETDKVLCAKGIVQEDLISENSEQTTFLLGKLKSIILQLFSQANRSMLEYKKIDELQDPSLICNIIGSSNIALFEEQQMLLEEIEVNYKLEKTIKIVQELLNQNKKKVKKVMSKKEESLAPKEDFIIKLLESELPEEARRVVEEEIKKLDSVPPNTSEYHVIKNYLDFISAIPWNKSSQEVIDIKKVISRLDEDHYGLEKVKKRIIEYLAVKKLKNDSKAPIICLLGPPGVGKTSLGESIAKSIGREFIRISLGGVRDEAEIRGHRKTYVGAMSGKIMQAIKRSKVNNPIILLDEIDKLTSGSNSGDPCAALLEVLDPEQNSTFVDHFLDIPFDLSKVFFIATANYIENIPEPLKDRMEIIYVPGYTTEEKFQIAKKYLIPKNMIDSGITADMLEISQTAIKEVISHYTRESGVRELKRVLNSICRASAVKWIEKSKKYKVDSEQVIEILGRYKYTKDKVNKKQDTPGVVTGLAWTPVGGDILFIETIKMPGTGKIQLTGQLGEVMKESASLAISYIRSNQDLFGINEDLFKKKDFHLHIPDGAIKKDGPSAGITMFSGILSLLLNNPIDPSVAMTGEITLQGNVTAVGGIKEKVIAAHQAGIKTIIMSQENHRDVFEDIPANIQKEIRFIFVSNLKEVHDYLFIKKIEIMAQETFN